MKRGSVQDYVVIMKERQDGQSVGVCWMSLCG